MIKRVSVWALCLVLTASLLPMSAFAATVEATQICKTTEHVHNDECYETQMVRPVICGMTEDGHTHGDECYAWNLGSELICDHAAAGHTHTVEAGCFEATKLLTCGADEHTHDAQCQKTCELAEHQHGEDCPEDCAIAEHTHDSGCQAVCSLQEHTHDDSSCYTPGQKLVCEKSDLTEEAEKHTEACYRRERGQLLCTLEEVSAHEHTEECYGEAEEQRVLICELEAHTHTKDCYNNLDKETGKTLEQALKDALANAGAPGAKDTEVTLILNGQTLQYQATGYSAIELRGGQTLNIEDAIGGGGIHGNTSDDSKNLRLIIITNGTVNLKGGTLSGGKAEGGGAVYVAGENSQLNMSGGSITGNYAATNGGGVLVEKGGQFTMTGGSISGNSTNTSNRDVKDESVGQGGGVAVGPNGSFSMSGGVISGNTAGEGGGVFVDRDQIDGKDPYKSGTFEMTGGAIDGNTATMGEGGGVYVKGEAEITKGSITNNVTYTHEDLGGGGIYIEADGVLTLKNAIITGNTANGMGGGIAACVHGKTYVYALEGAVITGNTALGQGHTQGHEQTNGSYNGSFVDGYTYWASAKDILKEFGQDIFAAGDGFHASLQDPGKTENSQGTAGIVVSNNLPSGGSANWSGYTYCYVTGKDGQPMKDDKGNYVFELTQVTEDNNGVVYGNRLVFLTATPDQESVQKAIAAMENGVIISGNLSANSHGGGIANNGVLTIGSADGGMTGSNSKTPEAELNKTLNSNDDSVNIGNSSFAFQMTDENGNLVGTVTNDENGKATFNFPPEYFNDVEFSDGQDEVEYVFYVTEVNDGQANVTYDGAMYKVVIKITRTTEDVKLGHETVTLETLSVGEPEILVKVVHEDGSESYESAPNGIQFTNSYTKPTDPSGGNTPGGEDPGNTPTPKGPEDPTEVEEPEVPLAERPEEPEKLEEMEIEDPDVPLSDIPQTGDTHLGWYGAAILSALGLMVMALLGRKQSRES